MTIKRHYEVDAGSRHAMHNMEYSNRANREAGTGEGSGITLTVANRGQVALQTDDNSLWVLSDESPITWRQILTLDDTTLTIQEGGILKKQIAPVELADGEYYTLPGNTYGSGSFMAVRKASGTAPELAEVHWDKAAAVTSIYLSTNAVTTNTPAKFCVYDSGSTVRVLNNLGYTIYLVMDLNFASGPVS